MKTPFTPQEAVKRQWHLIDAAGLTLGRLSTRLAGLLMGKHLPDFAPHTDMGDFVVVINAGAVKLTGRKLLDKQYYRHSGYPGGFRQVSAGVQLAQDPVKIIEHSVRGMLPKNKLQTPRLRRLKVYAGSQHPHAAQFKKEV